VVVVVTIVVNATKDGVSYRAAATRGRVFDWETSVRKEENNRNHPLSDTHACLWMDGIATIQELRFSVASLSLRHKSCPFLYQYHSILFKYIGNERV
jgi:hypothetical protein